MEVLFLLGRIILGGYFLMNAFNHFTKTDMLVGYAESKGIGSPRAMVYLSGLLLLVGGLGILLGAYLQWAVAALVLFLVPVSFRMHSFWNVEDPQMKMADMVNFTKNMALLGALLMVLAVPTPWMYGLPL